MSTTLQDIIALHYQGGGSDKLWAAALIERDGGTELVTLWGRRGAALQSRIDAGSNAARTFAKKRDEKLREGYVVVPADRPEDGILVTLHGLAPELVGLAGLMAGLVAPSPDVGWIEPHDRQASEPPVIVALRAAFAQLSPEQRAVVALHMHLGYTVPETAEIVGAPEETVRSRLRLARERLRRELGETSK